MNFSELGVNDFTHSEIAKTLAISLLGPLNEMVW
jgi:hypothetical protein